MRATLPARKDNSMKKLMLTLIAVAGLSAGAAFADEQDQAGSAWNNHPLGAVPGVAPNWDPHATAQSQAQGNYGNYGYWGNRNYDERNRAAPAYPYNSRDARAARRDRDGDGVPNAQDRSPDNPRRW
jgi:hypothetical protein